MEKSIKIKAKMLGNVEISYQGKPFTIERNNTLSCVSGVTQGRNFKTLPNPPNGAIMFDTS